MCHRLEYRSRSFRCLERDTCTSAKKLKSERMSSLLAPANDVLFSKKKIKKKRFAKGLCVCRGGGGGGAFI